MNDFVRHGKCDWCMDDDLDIFNFGGEEMCFECGEYKFEQQQLAASESEACEKYYASEEAEDWVPEDGFGDEDEQ